MNCERKLSAVRPCSNFNAIEDAYSIHEALKICDGKPLINILCHRTNNQRQFIRHEYQKEFDRCLIGDIKSNVNGNFSKILCALLTPPLDYRVKILNNAVTRHLTDVDAIIQFLCGYQNSEIENLVQSYRRKNKKSLEDDIRMSTSGHFKRIMLSILKGREEKRLLDYDLARQDAPLILQGCVFKTNPDEEIFNTIFCRRNYDQIRITNKEYKKITGHTLEYVVENYLSGSVRDALIAILSATEYRSEYFADQLHKSMSGLGTSDRQLIRIMVSRSEIDLLNIKNVFEQKYGKSLRSWIKGDTSGDYRDCLLALIHENC